MKEHKTDNETPVVEPQKSPEAPKRGWPKGKPRQPRRNRKELSQVMLSVSEDLTALAQRLRDAASKTKDSDALIDSIRQLLK